MDSGKILAIFLLAALLIGCGKYDAAGKAAEPPVEAAAEPAEPTEADTQIDAALNEPPPAEVPAPSPSDEELAAEKTEPTDAGLKIVAKLNSPQGMTSVLVTDPGTGEQKYVFSTTNRDAVITRLAAKIGGSLESITAAITFEGDAPASTTRKKASSNSTNSTNSTR